MHGFGMHITENGDAYEGEFKYHQYSGTGR